MYNSVGHTPLLYQYTLEKMVRALPVNYDMAVYNSTKAP